MVKHRLKKLEKRKQINSNKSRLLDRLAKNWEKALRREGVDGLDAMPAEWKSAIIQKKSPIGKQLERELVVMAKQIILAAVNTSPGKRAGLRKRVSDYTEQHVAPFFASRSQLYRDHLLSDPVTSPTSSAQTSRLFKQVMFLLFDLDNMFKRSYQQRFDLRVVCEMGKWNEWAQQQKPQSNGIVLKQSTSNLFDLYCEAAKVHSCYNAFFKRLAKKTGAEWVPASLKKIFRILEKAVLQKAESDIALQRAKSKEDGSQIDEAQKNDDDNAEHFDCCKVFDIVRGTLVYNRLAKGENCLLGGVRALYDTKEFEVLRLKDRFNNPTSACWRDVLVNGRMRALDGTAHSHIVEVQFHHKDLREERLMVAGHVIYERHRALFEACEMSCGVDITTSVLSKIHFAMKSRSRSALFANTMLLIETDDI